MQWLLDPRMGDRRGAYRGLMGRCEGKGPRGRPGHRWEDNIMMDLEEVGHGVMDLIELAEDRDWWWGCYVVMNLKVP